MSFLFVILTLQLSGLAGVMHRKIRNCLNFFIDTELYSWVSHSIRRTRSNNNKIIVLGPTEQAMWALGIYLTTIVTYVVDDAIIIDYSLGDKIASTIIAQSANVPTLPWSGARTCSLV
jgi:hypothetical protein